MAMERENRLWERQPRESLIAYEAFTRYLRMGADRTTARVAKEMERSPGLIRRWAADRHWTDRVREYDNAKVMQMAEADARESEKRGVRIAATRAEVIEDVLTMWSTGRDRVLELLNREMENRPLTMDDLERAVGLLREMTKIVGPIVGITAEGGEARGAMPPGVAVHVHAGAGNVVSPDHMGTDEMRLEVVKRNVQALQRLMAGEEMHPDEVPGALPPGERVKESDSGNER